MTKKKKSASAILLLLLVLTNTVSCAPSTSATGADGTPTSTQPSLPGNDTLASACSSAICQTYGASGFSESASYIAPVNQTEFIVAGLTNQGIPGVSSPGQGPNNDIWVARIDGNRNKVWSVQLGGYSDDIVQGLAVSPSGHGIVVGEENGVSTSGSYSGGIFVKYDLQTGAEIWKKQFAASGPSAIKDVAVDSSNNIYICGLMKNGRNWNEPSPMISSGNGFIAKYSPDGVFQWGKTTGMECSEVEFDGASGGSLVILFKTTYTNLKPSHFNLGRYSLDGVSSWGTGLDFSQLEYESYKSLIVSPIGEIFLLSTYVDNRDGVANTHRLQKFSALGVNIWTFSQVSEGETKAMTMDTAGNFYISGYSDFDAFGSKQNNGSGSFIAKVSSTGSLASVLDMKADKLNIFSMATLPSGQILIGGSIAETAATPTTEDAFTGQMK